MRFLPFLYSAALLVALSCSPALAQDATPAVAGGKGAGVDAAPITDEAQRVYEKYGDAVYQVQVIDLTSGKKSSIGSGFQFTADGLLATNYHVVAEAIQKPEANRLEYIHDKGEKGNVQVLMADVVHDVAILKMDKPGNVFVELGKSNLPKGKKLYSLGNPHDIGFTIIEGTNNGYSNESFIEKIHFSGSLNPGMSGGPTLAYDGHVVGINVSTAGNQISFLVPVEALKALQEKAAALPKGYSFRENAAKVLEQELLDGQEKNMKALLGKEWESTSFGPMRLPGRIHDALKCWGGPSHQEKDPYRQYNLTCVSQDQLFLAENFNTGMYVYRYDYIVGKDELNMERFYSLYNRLYQTPLDAYSNAQEDDVTSFECSSSFVTAATKKWKSSFCVRQYKKYPAIYDMHMYMALVGEGKTGMIVSLVAEGVSKNNALALGRRFLHEFKEGENTSAVPVAASAPPPSKTENAVLPSPAVPDVKGNQKGNAP